MTSIAKYTLTAILASGLTAGTFSMVQASNQSGAVPTDFPHMHRALDDLMQAQHSLENAEDRFEGHRGRALIHVHAAIDEVRTGLHEAGE